MEPATSGDHNPEKLEEGGLNLKERRKVLDKAIKKHVRKGYEKLAYHLRYLYPGEHGGRSEALRPPADHRPRIGLAARLPRRTWRTG